MARPWQRLLPRAKASNLRSLQSGTRFNSLMISGAETPPFFHIVFLSFPFCYFAGFPLVFTVRSALPPLQCFRISRLVNWFISNTARFKFTFKLVDLNRVVFQSETGVPRAPKGNHFQMIFSPGTNDMWFPPEPFRLHGLLAAANPTAAKIAGRRLIPTAIIRSRGCSFRFFSFCLSVSFFHNNRLLSNLKLITKPENSSSKDREVNRTGVDRQVTLSPAL